MKYTTVFLDFDDTLIDTQGYASKCLEKIYKSHRIDQYFATQSQFIEVYLKHTHELWDSYALGKIDKQTLLKDRFNKPFSTFSDIDPSYLEDMNREFMKLVVNIDEVIAGAEDLLKYLKSRYKVAMLSNGFSELQYDKMESVGFTAYFDEVILSDAVGINKPHPDIFTYALQKTGAQAETTIMIGDNYLADIAGAMESGIDQIWYNPNGLVGSKKTTYTVSALKDVMSIL